VARISPYVHFGQLSPRLVLAEAEQAGGTAIAKTFMRRLVWRDLAYWQLHLWPGMVTSAIRPHYAAHEWRTDPAMLRAWQRGRTGFPLVDAGCAPCESDLRHSTKCGVLVGGWESGTRQGRNLQWLQMRVHNPIVPAKDQRWYRILGCWL
jgi:FAD binding domain of DNA photolyase